MQSTYTPAELDYFRVLIKTIAVEDNYSIDPIVALNLSNQVVIAKLLKQRAEVLLDKWTYLGYFEKIDEQLYFGPKMQAEFSNFLKEKFPDSIQSCALCNCILLWVLSSIYYLLNALNLKINFNSGYKLSQLRFIGSQLLYENIFGSNGYLSRMQGKMANPIKLRFWIHLFFY